MDTTYTALAQFAQTWGLLYFVILFIGALAYALWPSNSKQFDAAAQSPLRED
ncbi:MAG: cbb3-type cytochrome c oxidase subunit 3 [Hyphomicrobiaceae bacterium]|nr:cbb3-type cytochrome c oxidase subunit 3 [Hyphomicrobiaceae bacterium]